MRTESSPPLIVWNHRWEFDKNPGEFFQSLFELAERDLEFEVAVLGECFRRQPEEFLQAREVLGDRIVQFGYCERFADYANWLWRANVLPVTSIQEFFGASVVEAIYCGCYPILPRRLAYPELLSEPDDNRYFYQDFDEFMLKLESALCLRQPASDHALRARMEAFDWNSLIPLYDQAFEKLAH